MIKFPRGLVGPANPANLRTIPFLVLPPTFKGFESGDAAKAETRTVEITHEQDHVK